VRCIRAGIGAFIVLTACTSAAQPSSTQASRATQAGPRTAIVPNLVGMTTQVADRGIKDAGLLLKVNMTGLPVATQPDGLIQSQVPPAGSVIVAGAIVKVDAVCVPKPCPSPTGGRQIYDPCTCASR
jgi:hypothetical protein